MNPISDLSRFDDVFRPVPLRRAVRLRLLAPAGHLLLFLWILGAISAEAWLVVQLLDEGLSLTAWARFILPNVLVVPLALRAAKRTLARHRQRLICGEHAVRWERPEGSSVELAYRDIDGVWLDVDRAPWLRITAGGREIVISAKSAFGGDIPEIVRVIGPRVAPDAIKERGARPTDLVEARAWDHFGDPPPIAMVPGRRYRYLKQGETYGTAIIELIQAPTTLLALVPGSLLLRHPENRTPDVVVIAVVLITFSVVLTAWLAWRSWRLLSARNDRFEVVPEGLRVIRKNRSWILTNPRRAFLLGSHGRCFIAYGHGLRTYYFDPRFLEEEV